MKKNSITERSADHKVCRQCDLLHRKRSCYRDPVICEKILKGVKERDAVR